MLFFRDYPHYKLASALRYIGGLILAIAVFTFYVSFTDAAFDSSSGIIAAAITLVIGYMVWGYAGHIAGDD
ncbi:MAG: hypothetical protein Q4B26_08785 [Eubacteriales bacterium]|nr:hypothetical protein [Eubacteriales bacterium]